MNYRLVSKYLGYFCAAIGLLMLPSAAWAVYFREWWALEALLVSTVISVALGALLAAAGRRASPQFHQRDALGLVGISWLVAAGLGGLPYVLNGVLGPIDAYFESMSGFTTTGSSVFSVEYFATTPKSIMFWRSFTHWLGGMGIIVLFIAVLPYLGAGGKQLFRSESPGPDPRGLRPRIKDTAKILYTIYLGLTVLETIALMFAGMSLYEALCQTFGTLATGGFSTEAASIGGFDSVAVDVIIIIFMVCAGSNFALYFSVLRGDWKAPWKDTEWRVYMAILIVCTLAVTANLMGCEGVFPATEEGAAAAAQKAGYDSFGTALRYASFQVVSIMTTTGFCTADFDLWPHFSRTLLVVLMFVGGCAGSTGGGIKVVRLVMLLKMAYWRLESTFRPKTIRAIRISDEVVEDGVQRTVYGFFV
ncbi:MAG: TrkH family potassium uptake protein, partial [Candidatus Hydrogenedentes bacterium]|nr:TrkH family potassium uptake protein [Candidatus Hydrogenedentota bacterium]